MVENYGKWSFDNEKYLILNFAMGGAYPFKTNGIKEPYNGVPAETVEAVKTGRIAMLVDWVRVWGPEEWSKALLRLPSTSILPAHSASLKRTGNLPQRPCSSAPDDREKR